MGYLMCLLFYHFAAEGMYPCIGSGTHSHSLQAKQINSGKVIYELWVLVHSCVPSSIHLFLQQSIHCQQSVMLPGVGGEGAERGGGGVTFLPGALSLGEERGILRQGYLQYEAARLPAGQQWSPSNSFLLISNVKKPCWFSGVSEPLKGMVVQLYLVLP